MRWTPLDISVLDAFLGLFALLIVIGAILVCIPEPKHEPVVVLPTYTPPATATWLPTRTPAPTVVPTREPMRPAPLGDGGLLP